MNRSQGRQRGQLEATAEHRRREDAAPRLREAQPTLRSMRLRFDDVPAAGRTHTPSYTRPIIVESAPAHFEIRCMEPRCDGRHDLTREILNALRRADISFAGTSQCNGMLGDTPCDRVMAYACDASYGS